MTMNGLRTLLTGRGLVESPRWHGDRLYFSDWTAGEVLAVDPAGRGEVIARVQSLPLCTAWLPDGRLVIVSSQEGLLLRLEPDGSLVTHANLGRPGWNDIVADGRGNIYVNGAGFNPMAGEAFRPGGVSHVAPDGSVRQVADDIAFPNGMAVTADNATLIVADSYRHQLVAFDIAEDGSLAGRRVWADLGKPPPTASAPTRRTPSGTPRSLASAAPASPKAAPNCERSPLTAAASPASSAARTDDPVHHRRGMARHDRAARWWPRPAARSSPSTSTSPAPAGPDPPHVRLRTQGRAHRGRLQVEERAQYPAYGGQFRGRDGSNAAFQALVGKALASSGREGRQLVSPDACEATAIWCRSPRSRLGSARRSNRVRQ